MGRQPQQVRSYSIQLRQDSSQIVRPRRNDKPHHLLDRLHPDQPIRYCGNIVEPVPVGSNHGVHAILGNLLHSAMEIADVAIQIDNSFAIEFQHHTQYAVRRRVLWPHVQHHLGTIEQRLLSCSYFYLVHKKTKPPAILLAVVYNNP